MIPRLDPPYDAALAQAIAYLHERFAPVAIVVSGTIIRGTAHATSDLDIVVVHDAPWRQRVQRWFNGVPAEMFVNPAFQLRRAMAADVASGRPVMVHMLATGTAIHDATGIGKALQSEARQMLDAGPQITSDWLRNRRYGIATMFEDSVDLATVDPDQARSLAIRALIDCVNWWFLAHGHWLPRPKVLLAEFERQSPVLSRQVREAIATSSGPETVVRAVPLVQAMLGASGFFEWESDPEPLTE